jgi:hypothetical protein
MKILILKLVGTSAKIKYPRQGVKKTCTWRLSYQCGSCAILLQVSYKADRIVAVTAKVTSKLPQARLYVLMRD